MKPGNKTKMRHYFITVLAVLTLIFGSAGCGGCAGCSKKDAREALEDAYEKTFTENNPLEGLLGLSELTEKKKEHKAYSSGLSLTLQELSGEGLDGLSALSGLGISMDSASDLQNRKASGSLSVNYGDSTYITIGGQIEGSKIHLSVPQLLDGSLSLDFSTLKEDLESDSVFAKSFRESGLTLPEDFSVNMLESLSSFSALEGLSALTSALDDFTESILVEVADKSVSVPDEVSAKFLYTVTIPADSYKDLAKNFFKLVFDSMTEYTNSLAGELDGTASVTDLTELNNTLDEMAATIGDINLTVAVNKDGYITFVTGETEKFTLTAKFLGKENPLHNTQLVFDGEMEGDTFSFTCENSFDTDTNTIVFETELKVDDETIGKAAYEGVLSDVEKGKKYTFDMNYLELELANALSVSLAGTYYMDTTKCDITAPTGTEYGLLTMTESDLVALVLEVLTNLQEDPLLSELLNYIDLGF